MMPSPRPAATLFVVASRADWHRLRRLGLRAAVQCQDQPEPGTAYDLVLYLPGCAPLEGDAAGWHDQMATRLLPGGAMVEVPPDA